MKVSCGALLGVTKLDILGKVIEGENAYFIRCENCTMMHDVTFSVYSSLEEEVTRNISNTSDDMFVFTDKLETMAGSEILIVKVTKENMGEIIDFVDNSESCALLDLTYFTGELSDTAFLISPPENLGVITVAIGEYLVLANKKLIKWDEVDFKRFNR